MADEQLMSCRPTASGGALSPPGMVGQPDLYPSGDASGVTDTAAYLAAVARGKTQIIWAPGPYYVQPLVVSSRIIWKGIPGLREGISYRPRINLVNGANDHLVRITTSGNLIAQEIDFWGNKAGQTGTSWCIYLDNDLTGVFIGSNAVELHRCVVRQGKSGGVYGGTNRNVGTIQNKTFILDCDGDGLVVNGHDWIVDGGYEVGGHAGNGVVVNGDSCNFVGGDVYENGLSGFVLGSNIRIATINGNQINKNRRHGVDASAIGEFAEIACQIQINVFYSNSASGSNGYSDIFVGNPYFSIFGNVHVPVVSGGTKVKYLVETPAVYNSPFKVMGAVYNANSYATDYTRDTRTVGFLDSTRFSLAGGQLLRAVSISGSSTWLKCSRGSDAVESFGLDHDGTHHWGSGGASATDTTLGRRSAGVLGVGAANAFGNGIFTTATRPSAETVGAGVQIYDSTLGKPIWSNGSVWKDASGATV